MANYANLKATINANIKANGNEEITGPILNTVLNQAVTTLGAGYQYMGVATPATSPGTPDANVFYIAATPGTYTNFGGKVVADGEVAILKYNGSWAKEVTGAATAAQVTQLGRDLKGKAVIPVTYAGGYLNTSLNVGEVVDVKDVVLSASYNCYIITCKENDKIIVNGSGGLSPRLWAFLDSSGKLISQANASVSATDLELTAPENAACVVLNDNSNPHKVSYIIYADSTSSITENAKEQQTIQKNEQNRLRHIDGYDSLDESNPNVAQGLLVRSYGEPRFTTGSYPNYRYTPHYYSVQPGQIIHTNGRVAGDDAGIVYYDDLKRVVGTSEGSASLDTDIIVPAGVSYARFCTQSQTSRPLHIKIDAMRQWPDIAAIRDDMERTVVMNNQKAIFLKGEQTITGETAQSFYPKHKIFDIHYEGQLNTEKRYIAIGFDDFRNSDFEMVLPLFEKYGFRATFNRIANSFSPDASDKMKVFDVLDGGHEMGDHTFLHYKFPFDEPLFNGQDPSSPEGSQVPFPSNAQMREDRGDGKNVFGRPLTETMATTYGGQAASWRPPVDGAKTWGTLTDSDCQSIRDWYSVMKDTGSNLVVLLDSLSNKYLGTTGSSRGSWNSTLGQYTGGIFSGCKTSANHEIWERYMQIMTLFYKKEMGVNYNLKTWSLPGSKSSRCWFEDDGKLYYDQAFTMPYNNLAMFASSLYKNQMGEAKERSWTDVLREFGFTTTHDANCPGRMDGQTIPSMYVQNIFNARQSRPDNLIYPTNRTLSYSKIETEFPDSSSFDTSAPIPDQMYNAPNSSFKKAIEAWRRWSANGVIWGEVIDSADSYSERTILEYLLAYCRKAGIEVITKQEAFDICFNHKLATGNLIYNPRLRNTAKEFMPDNAFVPTNPDGYVGICSTFIDTDGKKVLDVTGETSYYHFGIPNGNLKYSVKAKGTGSIQFTKIYNKTPYSYGLMTGTWINQITVDSQNSFEDYELSFFLADAPLTERDALCEYYGDKIIGIRILYSAGIQVKDIKLISVDNN